MIKRKQIRGFNTQFYNILWNNAKDLQLGNVWTQFHLIDFIWKIKMACYNGISDD